MVDSFEAGVFMQGQSDIFAHRHGAEQRAALETTFPFSFAASSRSASVMCGEILVPHPDLAGRGFFQAHERPQQRAFTRARTAQNHHRLARGHFKTDAVQNFALAVIDPEVSHLDAGPRGRLIVVVCGVGLSGHDSYQGAVK